MKKPVLVIMAAGMGSRYGGLKQIDPVDAKGRIIMDFSIFDAKRAGFEKVIFIIKKEQEDLFREAVGDRVSEYMEVSYAYQEINNIPAGFQVPEGRVKPWGTAHAVYSCKDMIDGPFAVINADDYYGKEAFVKLHDFLEGYTPEKADEYCMAGFILKNTLSENGAVTRGVCETNAEEYLTAVHETSNIVKTADGAAVDNDGEKTAIDPESYVSMNMWGLTPEFVQILDDGFKEFFETLGDKDVLKADYVLPIYIDELLQAGKVSVIVLDSHDKWFGVTYKEDKESVMAAFKKLIADGVYREDLFGDL